MTDFTPKKNSPLGWGVTTAEGVEIWDTDPVIRGRHITFFDWARLLFYPKKFILYHYINATLQHNNTRPLRILDAGCGTGASVVDLKKIFGTKADVYGIDVVQMQLEVAKRKAGEHGVVAKFEWYDGTHIPFPDQFFDAVYTSDVLGHVADVPAWLEELSRVTKSGGALAMFAESSLGKHAWIRKYLFDRGLNADPHARYHVSLYSKKQLQSMLHDTCFMIHAAYSVFWPAFLLHPEEFYPALQNQKRFPALRAMNRTLTWIKQKTHPFSTALVELYGLIEMLTIGRWVESQGYIILAKKK